MHFTGGCGGWTGGQTDRQADRQADRQLCDQLAGMKVIKQSPFAYFNESANWYLPLGK